MHERRGEERGEVREGEGKDGQEAVCGSCVRTYVYELTFVGVRHYVTHFVVMVRCASLCHSLCSDG